MDTVLSQGLEQLGFDPQKIPDLAKKMEAYISELQLFNSAYNLVNTDDHEELVIRHVFDSLAP